MRSVLVLGLFAVIIGGPLLWHTAQKRNLRNLRVVEPGVLYRSGKLTHDGIEYLISRYGIRTVVNFRAFESGEQPDAEEEAFCKSRGLRYERIVYRRWQADVAGQPIPGEQSVAEFFALMDRRKELGPILIHCLAGKHRTGAFTAIYRMEYQGWPNDLALAEMQDAGYDNLAEEKDVRGFLERYTPRRGLPR